jgi:uncharacterized protein YqfA (UPF0365 family)
MPGKRLVIDASVARAAGETEHPISRANRDLLRQVMSVCHKVVMTPDISREWKAHRSRLSFQWHAAMTARKKVFDAHQTADPDLCSRIDACPLSKNQRAAIQKDLHLIEAGLATDQIVISADDSARRLFATVSARVGALKSVVWVNPAEEPEALQEWLKQGARPVSDWQLNAL